VLWSELLLLNLQQCYRLRVEAKALAMFDGVQYDLDERQADGLSSSPS